MGGDPPCVLPEGITRKGLHSHAGASTFQTRLGDMEVYGRLSGSRLLLNQGFSAFLGFPRESPFTDIAILDCGLRLTAVAFATWVSRVWAEEPPSDHALKSDDGITCIASAKLHDVRYGMLRMRTYSKASRLGLRFPTQIWRSSDEHR